MTKTDLTVRHQPAVRVVRSCDHADDPIKREEKIQPNFTMFIEPEGFFGTARMPKVIEWLVNSVKVKNVSNGDTLEYTFDSRMNFIHITVGWFIREWQNDIDLMQDLAGGALKGDDGVQSSTIVIVQ